MKLIIIQLSFLLMPGICISQNKTLTRYKDIIFDKITVQKNLMYDSASNAKRKFRELDFYEPANDTSNKRPLIIWMHGGGFKLGTKNAGEIKRWGNRFSKYGYTFAAINYRLSKKNTLFKFEDLVEACYDNINDLNNAIQFFKKNASKFKIDTSKIIIGGNSAGSMIALQSVYSDTTDIKIYLTAIKQLQTPAITIVKMLQLL